MMMSSSAMSFIHEPADMGRFECPVHEPADMGRFECPVHEPADMGRFECPVQEIVLTTAEIQELLSLLQAGNSASPSSEGSNREVDTVDERKRRRMMSNRESARRSRWRKKRHLEDLTTEVDRLKIENQELKNRLGLVAQKCHVLWRENDRMTSESLALRARLSDLYRILIAMQTQYSQ